MKLETLKEIYLIYKQRIVLIIVLGLWVLIQYSLGNKSYILFIGALFLIVFLPRTPSFTRLAFSVLAIVVFTTPMLDTWTELKRFNFSILQDLNRPLTIIFSPNSGQEVLPVRVQQMLHLLRTHNISRYQLAPQFDQDDLTQQRIIESAWPIKMVRKSAYSLSPFEAIKNNPNCVVIDQEGEVALVQCH